MTRTATTVALSEQRRPTVLGIDPGIRGGWAIISDGALVTAGDLPVAGEGAARMIAGQLFAIVVREFAPTRAVIEMMSTRPGEAPSQSLRFGRAGGILEGVCAALEIPTTFVSPARWKKEIHLSGDKEASRQLAIRLWPGKAELFARKLDHGRAEAALIARFGAEVLLGAGQ